MIVQMYFVAYMRLQQAVREHKVNHLYVQNTLTQKHIKESFLQYSKPTVLPTVKD